jgi:SAM-dependent methyltransferase
VAGPIQTLIETAAANPLIFNAVRRVLENDFRAEKSVIRAELGRGTAPVRTLDLGCGTGYFAPLFDPRAYVGVDYAERFVAHARRSHPGYRFFRGDARRLGFAAAAFDEALVLGLLHHLDDDAAGQVASELQRVVRPGGRVLVMEDARHDGATLDHEHRHGALSHLGVWLFQWADVGAHIRAGGDYAPLFGRGFEVERTFTTHSGVCYYQAFVLRRSK